MEDDRIIELYWQRDESALAETQQKYNSYLYKIAYNILANTEDSEESVNDTYLAAWNSIPPQSRAGMPWWRWSVRSLPGFWRIALRRTS